MLIPSYLPGESERTRIQLRLRDDDLKHAKENSDLQALELQKWSVTQASYESEIQDLQDELNAAQTINAELDEQKHENLMLKETIDRMRFDMDEMRTNLVSGQSQGGGVRSVKGSVSKSLGAELANKMKEMGTEWGLDAGDEDAEDEERTRQLLLEDAGGDTEGEDVIETIITRTKRVGFFSFLVCHVLLVVLIRGLFVWFTESRQSGEED